MIMLRSHLRSDTSRAGSSTQGDQKDQNPSKGGINLFPEQGSLEVFIQNRPEQNAILDVPDHRMH